jgi:hypothetical protein
MKSLRTHQSESSELEKHPPVDAASVGRLPTDHPLILQSFVHAGGEDYALEISSCNFHPGASRQCVPRLSPVHCRCEARYRTARSSTVA